MIQQDFGHLIRQPKVPTKFENLPVLRDFRLKSHIFESCHLDQLQKAELRKKLVIQPFFVTWGVLRKTGFFPKWQVNTGKWQVKWQVENGLFMSVIGIFGADSILFP